MRKAGLMMIAVVPASLAMAGGPSIERGRELFNGVQLGTNGKSCATCHREGKKLERAASYDERRLSGIINQCIEKALAGKSIDPASTDMKSLIMYIKGLFVNTHSLLAYRLPPVNVERGGCKACLDRS